MYTKGDTRGHTNPFVQFTETGLREPLAPAFLPACCKETKPHSHIATFRNVPESSLQDARTAINCSFASYLCVLQHNFDHHHSHLSTRNMLRNRYVQTIADPQTRTNFYNVQKTELRSLLPTYPIFLPALRRPSAIPSLNFQVRSRVVAFRLEKRLRFAYTSCTYQLSDIFPYHRLQLSAQTMLSKKYIHIAKEHKQIASRHERQNWEAFSPSLSCYLLQNDQLQSSIAASSHVLASLLRDSRNDFDRSFHQLYSSDLRHA